ncbi:MAG TPA: EamA family transporter [Candidatus Dormibacteraeota bacterium]|nr:EamA family transporter [Candidatus Dormibacteraeota bacterium]
MKTLMMVFAMVFYGTVGDLLLKHGMTRIGAVQFTQVGLTQAFRMIVSSGTIWVAIIFLIGFMLTNMTVLSWADYSYVMPASAFGYAVVTFAGMTVLGETVTLRRWFGVALICSGVILVGQTRPRTTAIMEVVQ